MPSICGIFSCIKEKFQWCWEYPLPVVWFVVVLGQDIYSISHYWENNEKFCATLCLFVKLLSLVIGIKYLNNLLPTENGSDSTSSENDSLNTKIQRLCRRLENCLGVRIPIVWYFIMLCKACTSSKPNETQYVSDKALIQMTENFLESTMQATISIYIISKTWNPREYFTLGVIVRALSICFLSHSTVSYSQAIRKEQNKLEFTVWWRIFLSLLSLGQLGPRICLLGLFACKFPIWFWIGIAWHFCIMFITLCCTAEHLQDICPTQCGMLCHRAVFSCIYIYHYVNISENKKLAIIVFYIAMLFENVLIIVCLPSVFSFSLLVVWFVSAIIFCYLLKPELYRRNTKMVSRKV